MKRMGIVFVAAVLFFVTPNGIAAEQSEEAWWLRPQRLIQTNLREIDATMDIDQYVREVQDFGANIVLFNVGGIVANYPTELEFHWRNTFMKGDLVGQVVPRLHAAGIKVMGRFDFSKINEKFAVQHPEWLYVSEAGTHVNYNGQVHTCLMGGYQQEYVYKILKEAFTRYPLDAVFFNMVGFPQRDYSRVFHGVCQCENCRTSFKAYSGMDLPKHDGDPAVLARYKKWQLIQKDRQFERVRELIESMGKDIAICTYSTEPVDVMRRESGAPLGHEPWDDVERAQWGLLTTDNKQLSNASVHFYQMIFRHSAAGTYLHTRRLWQQMVNGAWLDFYCIGPLQRLEDRACIESVSGIYRFHRDNEKWLLNTVSGAEIGLVRNDGEDYWGWVQMLSEHHVPYDLVSFEHSKLERYKAIIVPDSGRVNETQARALDAYVQGGGKLLLSGKMPESLKSLGKPILKKTWPQRHSMYVRIDSEDKSKLAMDGLKDYDLVHLRGDFFEYAPTSDMTSMLRLIHDVTYGPPEKCYIHSVSDIPAMLVRGHNNGAYGNGAAAMLPFQIGAMYREWGNQGHSMVAIGTLQNVLKTDRRLEVDTSAMVEVTHRRDPNGDFEWIALYNHTGHLENAFHEPVPIHDIQIRLTPDKKIKSAKSLKSGKRLAITVTGGPIEITLDRLDCYDIVLVAYE